jgi:trigger factor
MKVTQEKLPASQIGLEIEISPEMSKQVYEKTLRDFMRTVNIPGFRKGKVPRQVLIQRFGAERLKAVVIEELVEESLKKAVEQEKINTIGSFQLVSSFDDLIAQFEPGGSLTFSAAVDVPPTVTLPDYKGLEIQAEEVAYQPEKVDEVIENYRKRAATLVPVDDRPAQDGDTVTIDFVGKILPEEGSDEEPVEFPGGSASDFQMELSPGRFIEGFIEGIVGMAIDETKDVSVTFPESYPQKDVAGKPAVFTITLKELKQRELPELDDDFAQEVSEFETFDEFRESIEKRYQTQAEEATKQNVEKAILDVLAEKIEAELPETLIRQELDYMLTQTAMQLDSQGVDIKQLFTRELIEQMRQRSRPEAIARIKRTLALSEIAKQESISVDEAAIEEKVKTFIEASPDQSFDMDRLREVVEEDLMKDKIIEFLKEHNSVTLVPEGTLTPAEDAAEDASDDDESMESEAVEVEVVGNVED